MQQLNLPEYPFKIRREGEGAFILDPIRQKYVALTPEEWVRQHFIQFLLHERGCPRSLLAVETGFVYNGMPRRADIIVYHRTGEPALVAECKAPDVEIRQAAFDQIARYNTVLRSKYLAVTNGLVHYCCAVDFGAHTYHFLDDLPSYGDL